MIIFNVSRETHGWAVRTAGGASTPYWSREQAVTRARALAESIRRHGDVAEVVVADEVEIEAETRSFAPRRAPGDVGTDATPRTVS